MYIGDLLGLAEGLEQVRILFGSSPLKSCAQEAYLAISCRCPKIPKLSSHHPRPVGESWLSSAPSSASSSITRRRIGSEKASKTVLLAHSATRKPSAIVLDFQTWSGIKRLLLNIDRFAKLHYPAILFCS